MSSRALLMLLLVLVVVVAAGAAWWFLIRPTEEDRDIAAIEKVGGKVERETPQGGPVTSIDLSGTGATDAALEIVRKFPRLTHRT